MGVEGLTTLLSSCSGAAIQETIPRGSTLVIDGDGFAYEVLFAVTAKSLERECGGIYYTLHDRVGIFVSKFRNAGLNLVVYFDGNSENKFKQSEWDVRDHDDDKHWSRLCYSIMLGDECPNLSQLRPELAYSQVRASLVALGLECIFCEGEADPIIAKRVRDENALNVSVGNHSRWYVYGDDSDYIVMRDCPYIRNKQRIMHNGSHYDRDNLRFVEAKPAPLCGHHFLYFRCTFGDNCKFSHSSARFSPNVNRAPLCKAYASHNVCHNKNCRHFHMSEADLSPLQNSHQGDAKMTVARAFVYRRSQVCRVLNMEESAFVNWCIINGNDCTWYEKNSLFDVQIRDTGEPIANNLKSKLSTYTRDKPAVTVRSNDAFIQEALEYYHRFYNTGEVTAAETVGENESSNKEMAYKDWQYQALSLTKAQEMKIAESALLGPSNHNHSAHWTQSGAAQLSDAILTFLDEDIDGRTSESLFDVVLTAEHLICLRAMCGILRQTNGLLPPVYKPSERRALSWKDFIAAAKYQNIVKEVLSSLFENQAMNIAEIVVANQPRLLFHGLLFSDLLYKYRSRNNAALIKPFPAATMLSPLETMGNLLDGLNTVEPFIHNLAYFAAACTTDNRLADEITDRGCNFPRTVLLRRAGALAEDSRLAADSCAGALHGLAGGQSVITPQLIRSFAQLGDLVFVHVPSLNGDYGVFAGAFDKLRLRYQIARIVNLEDAAGLSRWYKVNKINIVIVVSGSSNGSDETLSNDSSESIAVNVIISGARQSQRGSTPRIMVIDFGVRMTSDSELINSTFPYNADEKKAHISGHGSAVPQKYLLQNSGDVDGNVPAALGSTSAVVAVSDVAVTVRRAGYHSRSSSSGSSGSWQQSLRWIRRSTADQRASIATVGTWRLYLESCLQ